MRVTNAMTSKNILADIQKSYEQLSIYQRQLSSGLKIMEPSDNPAGAARVGSIDKRIAELTQFENNIDYATDEMSASNASLSNVLDTLLKVKQTAVAANNSINSQAQLDAYAAQIEQNLKNIITYANTSINNKYVFSGFQTATKPFVEVTGAGGLITRVGYWGDAGQRTAEVASGRNVTLSFAGSNTPTIPPPLGGNPFPADLTVSGAFIDGNAPAKNVFSTLISLRDDLLAGNLGNLQTVDMPNLNNYTTMLEQLTGAQAQQINELKSLRETEQQEILSKTNLKVGIREIDAAETMSNISNQQFAYQAALQVGSKVLQVSLFNYL